MAQAKNTLSNFSQGTLKSMRGAVAVEFALVLIPMLMLALGAAEYGRALYQYNTLVKASRDSVRHLSHLNPAGNGYAKAQTEAKCLAVYGTIDCTGQPLAPGLSPSMISISPVTATTSTGASISMVEVRITGYTFSFLLNPGSLLGSGTSSITFGDITATMRQS